MKPLFKDERDGYEPLIKGMLYAGHAVFRIHDAPRTGKKACDIVGVLRDGRAVAVECKYEKVNSGPAPASRLEPHQLKWLQAFTNRGGVALVVSFTAVAAYVWVFRQNGTGYEYSQRKELPLSGGTLEFDVFL